MATQEFLPPRRRRALRVYAWFAAAAVILSATGSILYTALGFAPESQVEDVLTEFGAAVDRGDQATLIGLLCQEEATLLTEDDDYDPTAEPDPLAPPLDREFADITVDGDRATAQVLIEGAEPATVHLRRDQDHWKLCDPAAVGESA